MPAPTTTGVVNLDPVLVMPVPAMRHFLSSHGGGVLRAPLILPRSQHLGNTLSTWTVGEL